ncbi:hypothetical protein [Saccharopolyspora griseoalba]|uniref:Uncharacterized protein n=1 Tax=Saccharopolyspora griseoalba TaxID=1431848 RepID=A0ABW2LNU0_9PSEU
MDTPIYTELREKLIDPEDRDWGQSAPPEFAAALAERAGTAEQPDSPAPTRPSATTTGKRSRSRARSHRKED